MKKYYFVGIGGSGMNPLAQVLRQQGHSVSGSDRSFDRGTSRELFAKLRALGISLFPQDGSGITGDLDCLVVSTAIEAQNRELEKQVATLKRGGQGEDIAAIVGRVREIRGIRFVASRVAATGAEELRELSDRIADRMGAGVIALAAEAEGRALLLVRVSKECAGRLSAGDIIKQIAPEVGGRGGGKQQLAQAGGPDPSGIDRALANAEKIVSGG